jgi:hypothetical protein
MALAEPASERVRLAFAGVVSSPAALRSLGHGLDRQYRHIATLLDEISEQIM